MIQHGSTHTEKKLITYAGFFRVEVKKGLILEKILVLIMIKIKYRQYIFFEN